VVVRYAGKVQVQEAVSGCSFLSSNDPRLHFGLGAATTGDIEVRWPSGLVEHIHGAAANQLLTCVKARAGERPAVQVKRPELCRRDKQRGEFTSE